MSRFYRFCLLALATLLLFAVPALAQSECATTPTGFVDGVPCFGFGGRMWKEFRGSGVESDMLIGPINPDNIADRSLPLEKLAEEVMPIQVIANATRTGRVLEFPIKTPSEIRLFLIRTPATRHDGLTSEVRIRTLGTGTTVFMSQTLTGPARNTVTWDDMRIKSLVSHAPRRRLEIAHQPHF